MTCAVCMKTGTAEYMTFCEYCHLHVCSVWPCAPGLVHIPAPTAAGPERYYLRDLCANCYLGHEL